MNTIALDVSGGDFAPYEALSAAAYFSTKPDCPHLTLVGDAPLMQKYMASHAHDAGKLSFVHTDQCIAMDDEPRRAIQEKPNASVLIAASLVAQGKADALVSAGNTGGVVLACAKYFQKLAGVPKCALGTVYPTEKRRGNHNDPFSLILDAGITLDVTADDLLAFAVMGSVYAHLISRNPQPTVALLSNGTESSKGTKAIVEAHQRLLVLKEQKIVNFIGNIEGTDIPRGTADVVVTGGFTGNIVIKMLEGVAETVQSLVRYASAQNLMYMAGMTLLGPALADLKKTVDWEQYGGAPVLGFDRLCIKAHGRSKARAIKNAIKVADRAVSNRLVENMRAGINAAALIR